MLHKLKLNLYSIVVTFDEIDNKKFRRFKIFPPFLQKNKEKHHRKMLHYIYAIYANHMQDNTPSHPIIAPRYKNIHKFKLVIQ